MPHFPSLATCPLILRPQLTPRQDLPKLLPPHCPFSALTSGSPKPDLTLPNTPPVTQLGPPCPAIEVVPITANCPQGCTLCASGNHVGHHHHHFASVLTPPYALPPAPHPLPIPHPTHNGPPSNIHPSTSSPTPPPPPAPHRTHPHTPTSHPTHRPTPPPQTHPPPYPTHTQTYTLHTHTLTPLFPNTHTYTSFKALGEAYGLPWWLRR